MIRVKLRELIAEKHYREGKLVTLSQIARETGIHRMTLTKIAGDPIYSTSTDTLDRLCNYFKCRIEQLLEFSPSDIANEKKEKASRAVHAKR